MRLIKAQTTNLRSIKGTGIKHDIIDNTVIDTTKAMLVAKGTTAERPVTPINGYLRYNTDVNEFEFYQNSAWRKVRYKEPNHVGITQQNLGSGDAIETFFGPLDSGDPDYPVPAAAQNILVFVENVFQISGTNYTLVQNPGPTPNNIINVVSVGSTTVIETVVPHGLTSSDLVYISGVESSIDDILESLNTDDSSSPGNHSIVSIPSLTQIELGVDTTGGNVSELVRFGYILKAGTTSVYFPGWYLQFSSPPDLDKPITVLHNFDK